MSCQPKEKLDTGKLFFGVLDEVFHEILERPSNNDPAAPHPVSETSSSGVKFESEDETDSFVLTPTSTSPRSCTFGGASPGDEQMEQTQHHSGSNDDVQERKEYLEELIRYYEYCFDAVTTYLVKSEAVIERLENKLAADEKQREEKLKLTADVAVRYKELDIYKRRIETLLIHLEATVAVAELDRNVASLWVILKVWLARKATAPPATVATTTSSPNLLDNFPGRESGPVDVKAWIHLYLTEHKSDPNEYGIWLENVIWDGRQIRKLSQVDLKTHLQSWGCGAPDNELLSKEIVRARRVS